MEQGQALPSLFDPPFVARSPAMIRVLEDLRRAAEKDATLLLLGETGTGKDVLAGFAHRVSPRRAGPFVTLDCGAIAPSLMESEMFGHAKGVFTGASQSRIGLVEAAHRGRLFLNEIGDSTPELQKCFLDLLQYRRFRRVGEIDYHPLDVAFVAATHRDLRKLSPSGAFRLDLYHRLRVVEIRIPPLRSRPEEIPELARAFLGHYGRQHGRSSIRMDDEALDLLGRYSWPGNVRELAHCIEGLVLRASNDRIGRDRVAEFIEGAMDPGEVLAGPAEGPDQERNRIVETIRRHGGNKLHAARALGIHRATLYRRLSRLSLLDAPRP